MHHVQSIQKALEMIEANLTGPLSLGEISRSCGMSHWHFQRTFAAMVGETVAGYIRRRRLTEAAHILESTPSTILDVALHFQFESHEAFTRAFKTEMRITPSAWRAHPSRMTPLRQRIDISSQILQQRYAHMKLVPEIIELPAQSYIGLESRFISATSPNSNNMEIIPKLWDQFTRRIGEIDSSDPDAVYGLSDCPTERKSATTEEAIYLASVRARDGAMPPPGMTSWKAPGGTYAKFIHRGRIEKISETLGYIYAQWLPDSDYERGTGPDIERCDSRFNPISDDSLMEFFIPVRSKQT